MGDPAGHQPDPRALTPVTSRPAGGRGMTEKRDIKPIEVGVAVMGPMRTGTTLVADLLTVRGKSLVFSEPDLLSGYDRVLCGRMRQLAHDIGLGTPNELPPAGAWERNIDHFDATSPKRSGARFLGLNTSTRPARRLFQIYRR
jgi:hypothetical protein